MKTINIAGIPKAELLTALVNGTQPLGMGVLQANKGPMTVERAQERIDACQVHDSALVSRMMNSVSGRKLKFDYVEGRPIKADIGGDEMRYDLFDRDAGEGTAAKIIAELRKTYPAVTP